MYDLCGMYEMFAKQKKEKKRKQQVNVHMNRKESMYKQSRMRNINNKYMK